MGMQRTSATPNFYASVLIVAMVIRSSGRNKQEIIKRAYNRNGNWEFRWNL